MIVMQLTPDEIRSLINTAIAEAMPKTIQAEALPDIVDRATLCTRLQISEPTVIRWEKKGKIPVLNIGTVVRYNFTAVLKSLEVKKG